MCPKNSRTSYTPLLNFEIGGSYGLIPDRLAGAYRQMHVIRKFEEAIRNLYTQGRIRGSFHPCVGQEATAVGTCLALSSEDYLSCTYRGHGHAIAKGLGVRAAMAEMLGKATGCSKGKGGSMHFTDPQVGLLGANAIVAAGLPHAAGAALAMQMQKKEAVAVAFFGEGAVNQGVYHETLNLIAIWKLPVILICENNRYSEMTPSHETTSTVETWKRAGAYGIRAVQVDGNDVEAMAAAVEDARSRALAGEGATYLEAETYRLWGHMMGDPGNLPHQRGSRRGLEQRTDRPAGPAVDRAGRRARRTSSSSKKRLRK